MKVLAIFTDILMKTTINKGPFNVSTSSINHFSNSIKRKALSSKISSFFNIPCERWSCLDTTSSKSRPDRCGADVKEGPYFGKGFPFFPKFYRFLNIPRQGAMMVGMFRPSHYFKVFDSIISGITVDMVDHLRISQLASYIGFHYHTMFPTAITVYLVGYISFFIRCICSLANTIATGATKVVGIFGKIFFANNKRFTANRTHTFNTIVSPCSETFSRTKEFPGFTGFYFGRTPLDNFPACGTSDFWHDITSNNVVVGEGKGADTSLPSFCYNIV
mgnify:CR=1 FL=1|jgi:hypothetical protein